MILDTSAIVAVLFRELRWDDLLDAMESAESLAAGAPTLAEAGIVVGSRRGFDQGHVARFVQTFDVVTIAHGPEHWMAAVRAYERFGKGRHPAGLTFGDCLSYATAHLAQQPLLCVGDDFAATDLPLVTF